MFCNVCGTKLEENSAFCAQCGSPVQNEPEPVSTPEIIYADPIAVSDTLNDNVSPKSRTAALLLAIFVGSFGINRFYLGAKGGASRLIMAILGYIFEIIGYFFWPLLLVAIPLLLIPAIGGIKDIIRTAKGTMVDGNNLPVTKW